MLLFALFVLLVFLAEIVQSEVFHVSLGEDIEHALLYGSGQAQVSRRVSVPLSVRTGEGGRRSLSLSAGHHELRISGLPRSLEESSLHLSLSSVVSSSAAVLDVTLASLSLPRAESPAYLSEHAALLKEAREAESGLYALSLAVSRCEARQASLRLFLSSSLSLSLSADKKPLSPALSLAEALEMISLADKEAAALQEELVSLQRERQALESKRERVQKALRALEANAHALVEEKTLSVHIYVPKDVSLPPRESNDGEDALFSLSLQYLVSPAVWTPGYDVRLLSSHTERHTLEIDEWALVSQQSGEHWHNVTLSLSTSSPAYLPALPVPLSRSVSAHIPQTFYAMRGGVATESSLGNGLHKKQARASRARSFNAAPEMMLSSASAGAGAQDWEEGSDGLQEKEMYAAISADVAMPMSISAQVSTSGALQAVSVYHIQHPVNVSSTHSRTEIGQRQRETQRLLLGTHTLEAALYTFAVPSQTRAASLVALAQLPRESVSLLASDHAHTRVEMDGSLVGSASFPALSPGDFFSLPLGENRFVRVSSQEIVPAHSDKEEDRSTWFVQDKKKFRVRTYERTFSVHVAYPRSEDNTNNNTDAEEVTVVLSENLPRSADAEVKVELLSPSPKSLLTRVRDGSEGEGDEQLSNEEFLSFLLRKELMSDKKDNNSGKKGSKEMRVYHCKTSGNLFWVLRLKREGDDRAFSFKYQVVSPEEKQVHTF